MSQLNHQFGKKLARIISYIRETDMQIKNQEEKNEVTFEDIRTNRKEQMRLELVGKIKEKVHFFPSMLQSLANSPMGEL